MKINKTKKDFSDQKEIIEKYSSAFTLSDMELFIFPELLYAGFLANIMSPIIWEWRSHGWFKDIERLNKIQKIHRIKQFIIDNYNFNLDLETWGLTDKKTEISRFESFINIDTLKQSNALFGYEGDKYYFDIGIRKHFGLDKYDSEIIPYWKTESVEAMDAFLLKENYSTKAGECVSLAMLYAAALFIVARIPLEKIFLMGTPLHSQNFVLVSDGVLTNNRRIVTKNMWFNGTELSEKARRAIENEKITIISHNTGILHYFYEEATIDKHHYVTFKQKLSEYLTSGLETGIIPNFLRQYPDYQKYFQYKKRSKNFCCYVPAEKAFKYEHNSKLFLNDAGRKKILSEIECDETYVDPIKGRIIIEEIEDFIHKKHLKISDKTDVIALREKFNSYLEETDNVFENFLSFVHNIPKINDDKKFVSGFNIEITTEMKREDIIEYLSNNREKSATIDLAFYAYRDFSRIKIEPFFYAAINRSPVTLKKFETLSEKEIYYYLLSLQNNSIYDSTRIAQPDELVNFNAGDGVEKAIAFAVVMKKRSQSEIKILSNTGNCSVEFNGKKYSFVSGKNINFSFVL